MLPDSDLSDETPGAIAPIPWVDHRIERTVLYLLLGYFILKMAAFATLIHAFVPPDEVDLFARCKTFSKVLWIPEDTPETAVHGLVAHRPFLYFWLMGKALFLNVFPISDLTFLRYVNIPIALLTVLVTFRCGRLFALSAPARLLVIALLTSTLQFWTLSATVTYDNLVNCLSIMAAYCLFELFSEFDVDRFLAFLLVLALGCLTKTTFLPLAAIFGIALVIRRRDSLSCDMQLIRCGLRARRPKTILLLGVTLLLNGVALEMYGGNLIRYGTIRPHAEDTIPLEVALNNRIIRRNWIVREFKASRLTYDQALSEVQKINNAGNRRRAIQLLDLSRDPEHLRETLVGPVVYFMAWTKIMLHRVFGYQGNGDKVVPPSTLVITTVLLLALFSGVLFLFEIPALDKNTVPIYASIVSFAYMMFLICFVNYPTYRNSGAIDYVVNGRYLFPVYPLLCLAAVRYGIGKLSLRMQVVFSISIATFFLYSDLPQLLSNLGPCWLVGADAFSECAY